VSDVLDHVGTWPTMSDTQQHHTVKKPRKSHPSPVMPPPRSLVCTLDTQADYVRRQLHTKNQVTSVSYIVVTVS